mmetsp:Transcript_1573/g.1383  ORF Transcript_1573/g.1383 Transcript_1573/m.1383 type:complete len:93 (+) Transcript_1573:386-664(+)
MIAHAFLYDATKTLTILTELQALIPVCQNFFSFLTKFTEVEHYRSLIYGISALIAAEELPDVIKSSMGKILESLILIMKRYTRDRVSEVRIK